MGKVGVNNVNVILVGVRVILKMDLILIMFGVEYILGKDDDDNIFNVINFFLDYGINYVYNGFMDYFFVGLVNGNVGVIDIFFKIKFVLFKGVLVVNIYEFMLGFK